MRNLEDFLTPTQDKLFKELSKKYAGAIVSKGNYILVPGQAPVMLLAHLDTVHKEPVKTICKSENGSVLMSPQGIGGDDRCGVYALVTVHARAAVKPWLLFTCNEEVGGKGASAFCGHHGKGKLPKDLDSLKLLIEIDRKGRNDAVYYDCANTEFEEYITSKGFHTEFGSFSDISLVAPELGVAAVNLSSGYYNAHTLHEYINRKQLNGTVNKVLQIVTEAAAPEFPTYEYVETVRLARYGGWDYGWGYRYGELGGADVDLTKIPKGIRDEYEMLLDYYTSEELDELRAEQGDQIISMLAESEFGDDYFDWRYGKETEGMK